MSLEIFAPHLPQTLTTAITTSFALRVQKEAKNLTAESVLRLIQIRLQPGIFLQEALESVLSGST